MEWREAGVVGSPDRIAGGDASENALDVSLQRSIVQFQATHPIHVLSVQAAARSVSPDGELRGMCGYWVGWFHPASKPVRRPRLDSQCRLALGVVAYRSAQGWSTAQLPRSLIRSPEADPGWVV